MLAASTAGLPLQSFTLQSLPRIEFGNGVIERLGDEIAAIGRRVLLVTGQHSFHSGPHWQPLLASLRRHSIDWLHHPVSGEPTPESIDQAVARFRGEGIGVIAAVGGGSVLDSAKAIAGLINQPFPVTDYLEGLGVERPCQADAVPWIAVPTTAGTGSEVTWNAVIGRGGEGGFKKSFRSPRLLARVAMVDPQLVASAPRSQLVANAMDAFTQLLESTVSTRATPLTRSLAWAGIEGYRQALESVLEGDEVAADHPGLARLAYGSLLSGIVLAHTGLGAVHGLAPILGAWYSIPHGVACGSLLAPTTAVNIAALARRPSGGAAISGYAAVGRLVSGEDSLSDPQACERLVAMLGEWRQRFGLPGLAEFGVDDAALPAIAAAGRGSSSMRTNPIELTDGELVAILQRALIRGDGSG